MISVETRQHHQETTTFDKKPPKVPPRTKKRLQNKESDSESCNTASSLEDEPEEPCPALPSRTKEPVIPPPIPSAVKPNKRAVLQTRQLLESEFLKSGGNSNPEREVLVAATKNGKEKRPEARQRQPAMLLRPNQDPAKIIIRHEYEGSENSAPLRSEKGRKGPTFLVLPGSKTLSPLSHHHQSRGMFPNRSGQAPMLTRMVFPRPPNGHHLVQANGPPVTYGKWLEKSGTGDPEINTRILRRIFGGHQMPFKSPKSSNIASQAGSSYKNLVPPGFKTPVGQSFSKSKLVVSRSGSLSSQCSTSSDSGNESQPKSVLKKSRRNKGIEKPKKSVTFNAMTTVQVMEE